MLKREDGHVLSRALDFEVEGNRRKVRLKMTWKKKVEDESVKVGFRMKMHIADGVLALIRLLLA